MSDQVLQQSIAGMEAQLKELRSLLPFEKDTAAARYKINRLKQIIIDMELSRVLIRFNRC